MPRPPPSCWRASLAAAPSSSASWAGTRRATAWSPAARRWAWRHAALHAPTPRPLPASAPCLTGGCAAGHVHGGAAALIATPPSPSRPFLQTHQRPCPHPTHSTHAQRSHCTHEPCRPARAHCPPPCARSGEVAASIAAVEAVEQQLTPARVAAMAPDITAAGLLVLDGNLSAASFSAACRAASDAGVPALFEPVSVPKAARWGWTAARPDQAAAHPRVPLLRVQRACIGTRACMLAQLRRCNASLALPQWNPGAVAAGAPPSCSAWHM